MSKQYRAVVCRGFGAGETAVEMLPRPPLRGNEVRVRLRACGVNFPDVLIVQGKYQLKPAFPFVPGTEGAGEIIEIGADVTPERLGTQVMVSTRTGGYAEEATVAADKALPLPAGFSFDEGATFMVAHMTSFHAIVTCGQVRAGQSVLVIGAGGGVGRAAVQIAKRQGAFVVATASSDGKAELARSAGADVVIATDPHELPVAVAAVINSYSGGDGVDVVYDPVGIASEAAVRCLTWGGRVLIVGFAGGTLPSFAANRILLKGATVVGVRAGEFGRRFPDRRAAEMLEILKLAAVHRPVVTGAFPIARFADALHALESRSASGRVVLLP